MRLSTFLASHARHRPEAVALIGGDERITFAELHDSTDRAASGLRRSRVGVGDRVAIAMENGIPFVQALLAVIKAGAVAVPVNLRLSASEIDHIVGNCQATTVLRTRAEVADLIAAGDRSPPELPEGADDCVISYTSGTTGKPKGAVLTQENYIILNGYLNGLMWGIGPQDRQLITTPLAQRTGLARVMNMVCHGSTLVIPPRFDVVETARLVETEQVTFMATVPTVARMLLPEIDRDPGRFASLRTFVATGEAFPLALKQRLTQALQSVRIHSFYAMTEVGLIASMGPDEQFTHPAAVGRIVAGLEVRLVDDRFVEVPAGEVGEIWVRSGRPGRWLSMRCYHENPEATAEVIRDGWVATGDLGRIDDDGYLSLVDRKKDMILTGGFNVYSREVEVAITELPEVRDVAVVGVPDEVFGEAVAAFVELEAEATMTEETIIEHCRSRLAGYKKPRHVHFVPTLPRNSTGKVLKRRLVAPR